MRHLLVVLSVVSSACGYSKVYIPVEPRSGGLHVPTEQHLMATAVSQAVTEASQQLHLSQYAGKSGQVEVNGVFPPSQADLLDYVATEIEAEMVKGGLTVLPRPQYPDRVTALLVSPKGCEEKEARKPDVRVVASLDWSGIDYTDKKTVSGGRVAGLVLVGVLTLGVGAVLWALAEPPTDHSLILESKVRLSLRAFPGVPGVNPAAGAGEGSSRVVIDPTSDSGHTGRLPVPAAE